MASEIVSAWNTRGFPLTPPSGNRIFSGFPDPPRGERPPAPERPVATPQDKIEEILDSIRPAIRADGGDVELVGFDEAEGVVSVRLLGACESCPISMMTLKDGIERRLSGSIPGIVEVRAV